VVAVPIAAVLVGAAIPFRPAAAGGTDTATCDPADPTCASAPAEPSPTLFGTPTALPSPTATWQPLPTPTPVASPPPTATPAPAPAPGPTASAKPPSPLPVPAAITGAIVVADPLLAAQVTQVLQHPAALERPDLLHFSRTAADTTADFVVGAPAPVQPAAPAAIGFAIGAWLLLCGCMLAAVLLWLLLAARQRRRLPSRGRAAALSLVVAITTALTASVGATPTAGQGASHAFVAAATPFSAARPDWASDHGLASHAATQTPEWAALVSIEIQLGQRHSAIVANEMQIASVSSVVARVSSGDAKRGIPPLPVLTDRLSSLMTQHASLQDAYQTGLKTEYDFFAATVQSPAQKATVLAAAAASSVQVHQAVSYDLELVQTQQAQEAAISAAAAAAAAQAAAAQRFGPPPLRGKGRVSFHAPLSGVVTQGFGPTSLSLEPPLTYGGAFYPHFHTGLDIAAALGAPVGAAADGVVVLATSSTDSAGHLVGYGNYVLIQHRNGLLSVYGHLSNIVVHAGQAVRQGQVIGLCGSTGWSTGPHVHFEIRLNDVPVDPAPYIASNLRR